MATQTMPTLSMQLQQNFAPSLIPLSGRGGLTPRPEWRASAVLQGRLALSYRVSTSSLAGKFLLQFHGFSFPDATIYSTVFQHGIMTSQCTL